ncbi:nucleolar MIF4G domain-containing protein 1 [Parasteatoda tepidariorum]|uniref:nucleolar MIF4G domain-containing protein 1 n=1 Tax=Parasteatoda tepidariorum TaxID=114398 RepID=UPI001C7198F3|nr:nucleolar MIF4G domain-containing protein 1 isoform X1 [Parasteatoda tepidariorum]XP_042902713.1 nucleolar MIF4G domain-containing protein 1 isoform X1 [Parasteatoda tepidariorum]XP_042902714.1 nucleolar MIF4G domain-containing protein 1 isoform X2 [Parasteatoda tepidariorum]XP_042902715.1 nucleolar MIF4G domain-containing protein 1 isoform X1 [Parasteatoda tepidariorum]XP_042902716.1 nucleolar MIF4G domain-containing protein 1 isoform X1 [Parasteatoda tepidariorum]XP_042902717.1 nucleolar 
MGGKSQKRKAETQLKNKKKRNQNTFESVRKLQLLEANQEEDVTIKRLGKLLKLNKKKTVVLQDDGLDYILGAIDRKDKGTVLSDDSDCLEEDLAAVKGSSVLQKKPTENTSKRPERKNRTLTELMKEKGIKTKDDSASESQTDSEEDDQEFESDAMDSENDANEDEESEMDFKKVDSKNKNIQKPKVWEDIYGRLRDSSGNVIQKTSDSSQSYVPPSRRKDAASEKKQEDCLRIKKQLKGLLNRLSESNLQNICHQIEELYMKYSRNDMNEAIFSLISEMLFAPVQTPARIILDQAMLIALLHANVGSEIGAFFLQKIVERLDVLLKSSENYGEGKECNNLIVFLSHLYNFKVTHSTLIFDIFELFIKSFQSKDIELIQLFLKSIGFVLRKDDPLKLKELILSIQAKAATFIVKETDSRVQFMLDTLTAIKNNNIYKIPDYDPSIIEHSKKLLKGYVRKGSSIQELVISYEDLLKADERGRWWIVGSAWVDGNNKESKGEKSEQQSFNLPKAAISEKILELARKQHMNTEIRKSVFCIIMTAEDYMDAFEKLLKLNLRNQQKREIIHVTLHCVLKEKKFNPYYAYLAGKFCKFARDYRMCLQFSLWDKFKDLSSMKSYQVSNLAHFLSHMFISGDLPISVLKTIQFSEMNKTLIRFFRQILLAILLHESEEICLQAFQRISLSQNLKMLRESLRLFMHHFLLRNQTKFTEDVATKLEERVKLVETVLKSKNTFKL